ncbi:MAG: lipid A deacylase LpxR family protein [Bacteroidota bacterium]
MRRHPFYLIAVFSLVINSSHGQVIDNTASFRNTQGEKYFRFHYENDFFSAADWYYSQGVNLEFVHPALKKFPLSKLLIHPKLENSKYGIAVEQDVYTPTSIRHDEILKRDRPYAGVLLLKTFLVANDSIKKLRFTSNLSIGVVGSAAGGKETQTSIHEWTGNFLPLGWQHQVKNDVAINYQVGLEKNIISKKFFLLNFCGDVRAGTLKDKVSTGLVGMAGLFDSPFHSGNKRKKFRVHIYDQPLVSAIGYDATLQGGLFNKKSDYTISARNLTRATFQNSFGIVFNIGKINLEYFQSFLTKEFKSGDSHNWGGIRMAIVM